MRHVHLDFHGPFVTPGPDGTSPAETLIGATDYSHVALNASTEAAAASSTAFSRLPVFDAHPDSGCTGSCTDDCGRLTNQRPCDEVYGQANGHIAWARTVGS